MKGSEEGTRKRSGKNREVKKGTPRQNVKTSEDEMKKKENFGTRRKMPIVIYSRHVTVDKKRSIPNKVVIQLKFCFSQLQNKTCLRKNKPYIYLINGFENVVYKLDI